MIYVQQNKLEAFDEIGRNRPLYLNADFSRSFGFFNGPAQRAAAQHFHTVKFPGWTQCQTICESPPRIYPNLPSEVFLFIERHFVFVRPHLNEVICIKQFLKFIFTHIIWLFDIKSKPRLFRSACVISVYTRSH